MSSNAPPKSVWSRSAKLVRLAAGLAQKEVSARVQSAVASSETLTRVKTQVEQARQLVDALGQLKGAAMKAGQLLSMELRDVLPPEVTQVLSQLQDQGARVGFDEIRSILTEELGPERLSQLDVVEAPLASASIGQVHRATWKRADGTTEDLVLKVQFRGIAETISSDLALLERIARLFLATQLKRFDLTAIFTELESVLQRETDYLHEADALERYRQKALEVPGLAVPRVFRELCSKRVLALSYEHGLSLDRFVATNPTPERRTRVTAQLLDLYFREFFDWGLVQTDANFANFLFRPERDELVLLDFGATREYDREFIQRYRRLLLATLRKDRPAALTVAVELGLIDPRESPAAKTALHEMLETVLSIFAPEHQPFDFTDSTIPDATAVKLKAFYKELQVAPPPAQLLFLHRKLGGVYSMGRALRAKVDLGPWARRLE